MLEIIVLNKYLIRGLDIGYAFSTVKDGKKAEIIKKPAIRKVDGINQEVMVSSYANFGKETYPGSLANCFSNIIDDEVKNSNISGDDIIAIIQIRDLVVETKKSIDTIARVLSYQEK